MTEPTEPTTEPVEPTDDPAPAPSSTPEPDAGLNEGGAKALRQEREARKAAEAETKRLREQLASRDRADVIRTYDLPDELADRLTGDTRDELEADAERLAGLFKQATDPEPPTTQRRPKERLRPGAVPSISSEDEAEIANRIVSRGGL